MPPSKRWQQFRDTLGAATTVALRVCLTLAFRLSDAFLLLWTPRLLASYAHLVLLELRQTPYADRPESEVELTYGETPLFSAWRLLLLARARRGQRFVDLGAGRGRFLLAARMCGLETRGCEWVPENVALTVSTLRHAGAEMVVGDARTHDVRDADIVYAAWTCWSVETRRDVVERWAELPAGARAIVLTWPIDDPRFEPIATARPVLSWGRLEAYVYRRV